MGKKPKGSRKGKKAWRSNIPTDDIDDFFARSTRDAQTGGSLASVPDRSLFYLDTQPPSAADDAGRNKKRKTELSREKVLHVDRILQPNPFVEPVPSSARRKRAVASLPVANWKVKEKEPVSARFHDLWDEEGEECTRKGMKKPVAAHIPAVEVEPEGCSFNPPVEAHQDSLAQAVAFEMQKSYRKELEPEPIRSVAFEEVEEEEKFFLDADGGGDDDVDENCYEEIPVERSSKRKRVTKVELNRRARRKERLKAEAEAQKSMKLLKQIDCLPDILDAIAKEDEDKQRKHVRRVVVKEERMKSGPPRLGKSKFEPAPPQVLLSEEISGSLRKLKGCCTLASDRYKSLEKRGLVVPGAARKQN